MASRMGYKGIRLFLLFHIIALSQPGTSRPEDLVKKEHCKECPENHCYEAATQHWCCECGPGEYMFANCIHSSPKTTVCRSCRNDGQDQTYTNVYNHQTKCNTSKTSEACDDLPYTIFEYGNASQDNKCVCRPGTFSKNPELNGCKPHFECPNGFGMKVPGNSTDDVKCEPCKAGLCSDVKSSTKPCEPCNINGTNSTVLPSFTPVKLDTPALLNDVTTVKQVSDPAGGSPIAADGVSLGIGIGIGIGITVIIVGPCLLFVYKRKRGKGKRPIQESHDPEEIELPDIPPKPKGQKRAKSESQKPLLEEEVPKPRVKTETEITQGARPISSHDSEDEASTESPKETGAVDEGKKKLKDSAEEIQEISTINGRKTETENLALPIVENGNHADEFRNSGYELIYDPGRGHNKDSQFQSVAYSELRTNAIHTEEPNPTEEDIQGRAKELRTEAIQQLRYNPVAGREPYERYINRLLEGAPGDSDTLGALSKSFSWNIRVVDDRGVTVYNFQENHSGAADIILGLLTENHHDYFVALAPRTFNPNDATSSSYRVPLSDSQLEIHHVPEQDNQHASSTVEADIAPQYSQFSSITPQALQLLANGSQAQESNEQTPLILDSDQAALNTAGRSSSIVEETPVNEELALILTIFDNMNEKQQLEKVDLESLKEALESPEYLRAMLNSMIDIITTSDLKHFIRDLELLRDVRISDIEDENERDRKEMRRKLLKAVHEENGRKLSPKILLERSRNYRLRKPYDDLCSAFVKRVVEKTTPKEP